MAEKVRVHLMISGLVQGVLFRSNTREIARELRLTGWVKNLLDGRVEAVFEGEKEKVLKIIEWAKRGPELAQIENIEIKWEEYKGEFDDFEIRYD